MLQKWKVPVSRYYKLILHTEFGTFVTEMEGTSFHVLQGNFADRIWHIFYRKGRYQIHKLQSTFADRIPHGCYRNGRNIYDELQSYSLQTEFSTFVIEVEGS